MAPPHQAEQDRRPSPLGLRGISRAAFQPRSPATGALLPLGLARRGPLPSFHIGTAGCERQPSFSIGTAGSERVVPRRRVGLSRPARPPATHEAGSSNWTTSVVNGRTDSGGSDRPTFVGFSLSNSGDGISFSGNESMGFNFFSGAGGTRTGGSSSGIRIGESSCHGTTTGIGGEGNGWNNIGGGSSGWNIGGNTTGIGGDGSGESIGYRGKGYNPNFEHAEAYPPSQEQTHRKELDLNAMANKIPRRHYRTNDKRHIYAMILERNGTGSRLKRGVSKAVAEAAKCPRRVVQRIWKEAKKGGGITSVKNNRKLKSGRKKVDFDIEALEQIPPGERTTLEQVAEHLNVSRTTIWRRLKEKQIRRITSELKPSLTEENKKARVDYWLRHLEPCSLEHIFAYDPTFKAGMNVVHIDEKWFFRTRKTQKMYLSHREKAPERECKHKNHIQKIMFLSAMARPRYDAQGNCVFDGKIGVWAYTEWVQAQKRSRNRLRGAWELKPCASVDKAKSREYLVKYVLPAIKAKWPESDRWNTIYIQQDNAKTHITPDDLVFLTEAAMGGWDIRMVYQPPNSPDTNILDLGWFASIQAMFHRKMPKTLPEIVQKVEQSLAEYPHQKLNRIWLSHQACMREIIKHKGSIHYALPHMKKKY
ncbi:hypothetical protein ACQ4PT_050688 [Festuca glaucescens]